MRVILALLAIILSNPGSVKGSESLNGTWKPVSEESGGVFLPEESFIDQ